LTEVELKNAYLESCKRTHPDVNNGSNHQFLLVENAFNKLKHHLQNQTQSQPNITEQEEEQEEDSNRVKNKVPQHRQYLSYDGVGFGTPSDRLKQYQKHRLTEATDSVNEFQLNKIKSESQLSQNDSLVLRDLKRQIKIKQAFDRLVEDLIQESIAKGTYPVLVNLLNIVQMFPI